MGNWIFRQAIHSLKEIKITGQNVLISLRSGVLSGEAVVFLKVFYNVSLTYV